MGGGYRFWAVYWAAQFRLKTKNAGQRNLALTFLTLKKTQKREGHYQRNEA
jgi:hypothetical protein